MFWRIVRFVSSQTKRLPVTDERFSGYESVASAYECWANRAATPQAARYWANHARAIREMIADLRATRSKRSGPVTNSAATPHANDSRLMSAKGRVFRG